VVVLNVKAPADLVDALRERARRADRSMSAEIRRAIRAHLATPEPQDAPAPTPPVAGAKG
jgi:plasmid stability protein